MYLEDVECNISGVYIIRNNKNGKVYIGSSKDIKKRWVEHIKNLDDNCHHSMKLQEDWNKFGKENFEFHILEKCKYGDAKKKETEYIEKFNSNDFGYNIKNFKENTQKRYDMFLDKIKEFISSTYKSDGKTYEYDFWEFIGFIKLPVSEVLKNFGINSRKSINLWIKINEEEDLCGLMVNENYDLSLYVTNRNKWDKNKYGDLECC